MSKLAVTPELARRLWPLSAATILWVLLIRNRLSGAVEEDDVPTATEVIGPFLGAFFADRERGEVCPPLAAELRELGEGPPADVAEVLVVLFACLHLDGRQVAPLWLRFRECAELTAAVPSRLRTLYERFIVAEAGPPWERVEAAVEQLKAIDWPSQPGYQTLRAVHGWAEAKPRAAAPPVPGSPDAWRVTAGRLTRKQQWAFRAQPGKLFCTNPDCARAYLEDPSKSGLRDQRPVVCGACGAVLIPDTLVTAFERIDGHRLG